MTLFLYKPHVVGAEGQITSPDVVVDHLFVNRAIRPVRELSTHCWQQAAQGDTGKAAYGVMALGGGALLLPAVVLNSGVVVLSRMAWRLHHLDRHISNVCLNGTKLSDVGLPAAEIADAGGSGDALPRGYLLIKTVAGDALGASLVDDHLGRELVHKVVPEYLGQDRWGDGRPKPRYSVGPTQKDVPHFI